MLKTNLKKAASAAGKFVEDHKVAIAITGTLVATATLSRFVRNATIEAHEDFLREKGLTEEFITKYFQDPTDV